MTAGQLLGRADATVDPELSPSAGKTAPSHRPQALGVDQARPCAEANKESGKLDVRLADAIIEGRAGGHRRQARRQLSVVVWQTGSSTQSNMNANEVIANRASRCSAARSIEGPGPSQMTIATWASPRTTPSPRQMHIAAAVTAHEVLIPGLGEARRRGSRPRPTRSADSHQDRPHPYQDPHRSRLDRSFRANCRAGQKRGSSGSSWALPGIYELAQGWHGGGHRSQHLARLVRDRWRPTWRASRVCPSSPRPTSSRRSRHMTRWSSCPAAIKTVAMACYKIANDMRFLGSGPRSGLGELDPARERAGIVHHAGQGEPDPGRSHDAGLRPYPRQ